MPAEERAEDSSELTEEDTDAAEEVTEAAAVEADDKTVATLPAELCPELFTAEGCT